MMPLSLYIVILCMFVLALKHTLSESNFFIYTLEMNCQANKQLNQWQCFALYVVDFMFLHCCKNKFRLCLHWLSLYIYD